MSWQPLVANDWQVHADLAIGNRGAMTDVTRYTGTHELAPVRHDQ